MIYLKVQFYEIIKYLMTMFEKLRDAARRDEKLAKIIVGVVAVMLVIFIGMRIMNVSDSGRQKVLTKAMLNVINAESFHIVADLDLDLPTPRSGVERRLVDIAVDIQGDVQWTDDGPELFGDLRLETTGRGIILFADGKLQILKDAVVFRLDNLPTILNPNGNLVEKWTYVEVPVLETRNNENVRAALLGVMSSMEYVGKVTEEKREQLHFRRGFTEEQELELVEVFRHGNSGNRALHILARLMRAYTIESLDVWVDEDETIVRKVAVVFAEGEGESKEQVATVVLTLDEFGKKVVSERPPKELTVQPEVFGRIFGRGEVPNLEGVN